MLKNLVITYNSTLTKIKRLFIKGKAGERRPMAHLTDKGNIYWLKYGKMPER